MPLCFDVISLNDVLTLEWFYAMHWFDWPNSPVQLA